MQLASQMSFDDKRFLLRRQTNLLIYLLIFGS